MYAFIIPLLLGFALAGASAFTAAYSRLWGERGGQFATVLLRTKWGVALGVMALGVLALAVWLVWRPTPPTPGVLGANGRVEGDQAAVGTKVGGKIVRLAVREGDQLEAGALIAELASDQVQAQLEQTQHALHTAQAQITAAAARVVSTQRQIDAARTAVTLAERESQAQVGAARAALGAVQAQLHQAEADLEKTTKDYGRSQGLFAKKIIAAQQLDAARAAHDVAQAAVEAARQHMTHAEKALELAQASQVQVELRRQEVQTLLGQLVEAQAGVETARAQSQTAEATVRLAQANLNDTRVVAPFTGTVLKKLVEAGEVVAVGAPLLTLVDLARLYAKVYVAEGDLGRVKVGDPARVYTDAFPRRYFEATVSEIAQQAEFTPRDIHMQDERVKQVFAVKLAIHNPQGVLKPGMPVDARIQWTPQAPWGDGLE